MKRMIILVLLGVGGCGGEVGSEAASVSQELGACSWLMGGECRSLPRGNWRSPEFWADLYLKKYATQRQRALENIEAGPAPLAEPRTVLLITGVTIKAEWFDPIVARLKRDGFRPVV